LETYIDDQETIFLLQKFFLAAMRDLPNLIQLDFQASFGTMACFLERKTAPFGSRPRPMKFKMTNAVIAADVSRDA